MSKIKISERNLRKYLFEMFQKQQRMLLEAPNPPPTGSEGDNFEYQGLENKEIQLPKQNNKQKTYNNKNVKNIVIDPKRFKEYIKKNGDFITKDRSSLQDWRKNINTTAEFFRAVAAGEFNITSNEKWGWQDLLFNEQNGLLGANNWNNNLIMNPTSHFLRGWPRGRNAAAIIDMTGDPEERTGTRASSLVEENPDTFNPSHISESPLINMPKSLKEYNDIAYQNQGLSSFIKNQYRSDEFVQNFPFANYLPPDQSSRKSSIKINLFLDVIGSKNLENSKYNYIDIFKFRREEREEQHSIYQKNEKGLAKDFHVDNIEDLKRILSLNLNNYKEGTTSIKRLVAYKNLSNINKLYFDEQKKKLYLIMPLEIYSSKSYDKVLGQLELEQINFSFQVEGSQSREISYNFKNCIKSDNIEQNKTKNLQYSILHKIINEIRTNNAFTGNILDYDPSDSSDENDEKAFANLSPTALQTIQSEYKKQIDWLSNNEEFLKNRYYQRHFSKVNIDHLPGFQFTKEMLEAEKEDYLKNNQPNIVKDLKKLSSDLSLQSIKIHEVMKKMDDNNRNQILNSELQSKYDDLSMGVIVNKINQMSYENLKNPNLLAGPDMNNDSNSNGNQSEAQIIHNYFPSLNKLKLQRLLNYQRMAEQTFAKDESDVGTSTENLPDFTYVDIGKNRNWNDIFPGFDTTESFVTYLIGAAAPVDAVSKDDKLGKTFTERFNFIDNMQSGVDAAALASLLLIPTNASAAILTSATASLVSGTNRGAHIDFLQNLRDKINEHLTNLTGKNSQALTGVPKENYNKALKFGKAIELLLQKNNVQLANLNDSENEVEKYVSVLKSFNAEIDEIIGHERFFWTLDTIGWIPTASTYLKARATQWHQLNQVQRYGTLDQAAIEITEKQTVYVANNVSGANKYEELSEAEYNAQLKQQQPNDIQAFKNKYTQQEKFKTKNIPLQKISAVRNNLPFSGGEEIVENATIDVLETAIDDLFQSRKIVNNLKKGTINNDIEFSIKNNINLSDEAYDILTDDSKNLFTKDATTKKWSLINKNINKNSNVTVTLKSGKNIDSDIISEYTQYIKQQKNVHPVTAIFDPNINYVAEQSDVLESYAKTVQDISEIELKNLNSSIDKRINDIKAKLNATTDETAKKELETQLKQATVEKDAIKSRTSVNTNLIEQVGVVIKGDQLKNIIKIYGKIFNLTDTQLTELEKLFNSSINILNKLKPDDIQTLLTQQDIKDFITSLYKFVNSVNEATAVEDAALLEFAKKMSGIKEPKQFFHKTLLMQLQKNLNVDSADDIFKMPKRPDYIDGNVRKIDSQKIKTLINDNTINEANDIAIFIKPKNILKKATGIVWSNNKVIRLNIDKNKFDIIDDELYNNLKNSNYDIEIHYSSSNGGERTIKKVSEEINNNNNNNFVNDYITNDAIVTRKYRVKEDNNGYKKGQLIDSNEYNALPKDDKAKVSIPTETYQEDISNWVEKSSKIRATYLQNALNMTQKYGQFVDAISDTTKANIIGVQDNLLINISSESIEKLRDVMIHARTYDPKTLTEFLTMTNQFNESYLNAFKYILLSKVLPYDLRSVKLKDIYNDFIENIQETPINVSKGTPKSNWKDLQKEINDQKNRIKTLLPDNAIIKQGSKKPLFGWSKEQSVMEQYLFKMKNTIQQGKVDTSIVRTQRMFKEYTNILKIFDEFKSGVSTLNNEFENIISQIDKSKTNLTTAKATNAPQITAVLDEMRSNLIKVKKSYADLNEKLQNVQLYDVKGININSASVSTVSAVAEGIFESAFTLRNKYNYFFTNIRQFYVENTFGITSGGVGAATFLNQFTRFFDYLGETATIIRKTMNGTKVGKVSSNESLISKQLEKGKNLIASLNTLKLSSNSVLSRIGNFFIGALQISFRGLYLIGKFLIKYPYASNLLINGAMGIYTDIKINGWSELELNINNVIQFDKQIAFNFYASMIGNILTNGNNNQLSMLQASISNRQHVYKTILKGLDLFQASFESIAGTQGQIKAVNNLQDSLDILNNQNYEKTIDLNNNSEIIDSIATIIDDTQTNIKILDKIQNQTGTGVSLDIIPEHVAIDSNITQENKPKENKNFLQFLDSYTLTKIQGATALLKKTATDDTDIPELINKINQFKPDNINVITNKKDISFQIININNNVKTTLNLKEYLKFVKMSDEEFDKNEEATKDVFDKIRNTLKKETLDKFDNDLLLLQVDDSFPKFQINPEFLSDDSTNNQKELRLKLFIENLLKYCNEAKVGLQAIEAPLFKMKSYSLGVRKENNLSIPINKKEIGISSLYKATATNLYKNLFNSEVNKDTGISKKIMTYHSTYQGDVSNLNIGLSFIYFSEKIQKIFNQKNDINDINDINTLVNFYLLFKSDDKGDLFNKLDAIDPNNITELQQIDLFISFLHAVKNINSQQLPTSDFILIARSIISGKSAIQKGQKGFDDLIKFLTGQQMLEKEDGFTSLKEMYEQIEKARQEVSTQSADSSAAATALQQKKDLYIKLNNTYSQIIEYCVQKFVKLKKFISTFNSVGNDIKINTRDELLSVLDTMVLLNHIGKFQNVFNGIKNIIPNTKGVSYNTEIDKKKKSNDKYSKLTDKSTTKSVNIPLDVKSMLTNGIYGVTNVDNDNENSLKISINELSNYPDNYDVLSMLELDDTNSKINSAVNRSINILNEQEVSLAVVKVIVSRQKLYNRLSYMYELLEQLKTDPVNILKKGGIIESVDHLKDSLGDLEFLKGEGQEMKESKIKSKKGLLLEIDNKNSKGRVSSNNSITKSLISSINSFAVQQKLQNETSKNFNLKLSSFINNFNNNFTEIFNDVNTTLEIVKKVGLDKVNSEDINDVLSLLNGILDKKQEIIKSIQNTGNIESLLKNVSSNKLMNNQGIYNYSILTVNQKNQLTKKIYKENNLIDIELIKKFVNEIDKSKDQRNSLDTSDIADKAQRMFELLKGQLKIIGQINIIAKDNLKNMNNVLVKTPNNISNYLKLDKNIDVIKVKDAFISLINNIYANKIKDVIKDEGQDYIEYVKDTFTEATNKNKIYQNSFIIGFYSNENNDHIKKVDTLIVVNNDNLLNKELQNEILKNIPYIYEVDISSIYENASEFNIKFEEPVQVDFKLSDNPNLKESLNFEVFSIKDEKMIFDNKQMSLFDVMKNQGLLDDNVTRESAIFNVEKLK